MKITVQEVKGVKVVRMEGSMSTDAAYDVMDELKKELQDEKNNMIINLLEVKYISSTALRVFLVIGKELKAREGELRFCCLNKIVQEVFDLSGFTSSQMFQAFKSEAAALEGF
jgi:anti-anti-sigma factor